MCYDCKHQSTCIEDDFGGESRSLFGESFWTTKPLERLGIPSMFVSDGPHGLRKQGESGSDHLGLGASVPATCSTLTNMASSWNRDLAAKVGKAIALECQAEQVGVLLGPGVNIKRSPLCGRNFEYYSEDPYLAGEMAADFIAGFNRKVSGLR